jgi:hypothetical protein
MSASDPRCADEISVGLRDARRRWLERKSVADHLADQHGVFYTPDEFAGATLEELERVHAEQTTECYPADAS